MVLRIYIKQILINIIVNLMPYYFTKFIWCRRLIYQSTNKYNPIDLDLLQESLNDYSGELDAYDYYENTNLTKYNFY